MQIHERTATLTESVNRVATPRSYTVTPTAEVTPAVIRRSCTSMGIKQGDVLCCRFLQLPRTNNPVLGAVMQPF